MKPHTPSRPHASSQQTSRAAGPAGFQPGAGHSPASRRRAEQAAAALRSYASGDDRIPAEQISVAIRAAVLATDRTWASSRCRILAGQLRLLPPMRG